MESTANEKLQQSISECGKVTMINLKKYSELVEDGSKQVVLLIAQKTSIDTISLANIEDTDIYETDPDIKLKLNYAIQKEMNEVEEAINVILEDLDQIFSIIIGQCDKVFNVYRSGLDNLAELGDCGEFSCLISKKVEAFDLFKQRFTDINLMNICAFAAGYVEGKCYSHLARKYSFNFFHLGGDINKLPKLWKSSNLRNLQTVCKAMFEE